MQTDIAFPAAHIANSLDATSKIRYNKIACVESIRWALKGRVPSKSVIASTPGKSESLRRNQRPSTFGFNVAIFQRELDITIRLDVSSMATPTVLASACRRLPSYFKWLEAIQLAQHLHR